MLNKVREKARISPPGAFYVDCLTVKEGIEGIPPDDAPVLISKADQVNLLRKFAKDNLLLGVEFEDDFRRAIVLPMNLDIHSDENPYDPEVVSAEVQVGVIGGTLTLNETTGFVRLNKMQIGLNPSSKEFRIISKLAKSEHHQASYSELIDGNNTKDSRRKLGFAIRDLKEMLGILPKERSKNRDIIKNIKNYGYQLIT